MLKPSDRWGPFTASLPPAERDARLRVLRAIVRLTCGNRGDHVVEALGLVAARLRDPGEGLDGIAALERTLEVAAAAIARLEPLDRRRVLASYAGTERFHSTPIRLEA